jgi:hypothetical protein
MSVWPDEFPPPLHIYQVFSAWQMKRVMALFFAGDGEVVTSS